MGSIPIDLLAIDEGAYWITETENLLLHLDSIMFPTEQHAVYSDAKISGHITYQGEHEAYFFNSTEYFEALKASFLKTNITPEISYYEAQRHAVVLSAYADRLRAWDLYRVPIRSLPKALCDDRIPWEVRRSLQRNEKVKEYSHLSRGRLRTLTSGRVAAESVDLIIIAMLANHTYRNGIPIELLRPFVLT